MKDLTTFLKEELSIPSTPSSLPAMGDFENGDIANDVKDTFSDDFKLGNSPPSNGKKKKDYIVTLNDVGGKVQFGESEITFVTEKDGKKFFDQDGNSILNMPYDENHPLFDVLGV